MGQVKKFDVKALREKVIAADDIKFDSVYVPEWDAELPVKTLSAKDMKRVMAAKDDPIRFLILAVLYGCVTQDGERVFQESDLAIFEDRKGVKAIGDVGKKVLELSGMADESEQAIKN